MTAYYNEIDTYAAAWLNELILAGHIAFGVVDTRSIEDVTPNDLRGFTQCHFFAGIGVWSYALRRAGWPDDKPVWTGSCPCQPFSAAGKGNGFDDERHLWPAWQWLIEQCRPSIVFGEQVASKATDAWIDLVHSDVEALGYAFGCVPFPSAGVGAPHIRDRAYWVADAAGSGWTQKRTDVGRQFAGDSEEGRTTGFEHGRSDCGLEYADGIRCDRRTCGTQEGGRDVCEPISGSFSEAVRPGPTNGFWRDADWLGCRDGKFRPVEPGTFPLVDGAPSRVGRLRAYGNCINAEAARIFTLSATEAMDANSK